MIPIGTKVYINDKASSFYKKIFPSDKEYYVLRYNFMLKNYIVVDEDMLHIPSEWVCPVESNLTIKDVL